MGSIKVCLIFVISLAFENLFEKNRGKLLIDLIPQFLKSKFESAWNSLK